MSKSWTYSRSKKLEFKCLKTVGTKTHTNNNTSKHIHMKSSYDAHTGEGRLKMVKNERISLLLLLNK